MTLAVLRKEMAVLWASPLPYVVGALFNGVTGMLYVDQLRGREQALLQPLFPLAGFLLLLAVPVLAMRSFADERRTGSLDLLLAVPVRPGGLVIGKWLAVWLVSLLVLAPTLAFVGFVHRFGDPDPGPMITGYLGMALLAGAVAAIGVFASSLTSSQPVAAMVTLFTVLLLWFSQVGPDAVSVGTILAHLSLSERLRSFASGAVDTGDVVFLLCLTAAGLVLASVVVRRTRRLGRVAAAALLLAMVVAVDVVGEQRRHVFDLTLEDSLSLTDQTKEVLGRVKAPTRISVFLPPDDPDRSAAGPLLLRYQRLNRRVSVEIRDPQEARGDAVRLGVDPTFGGVAVHRGDQVEHADTVTEQHITGAFVRLERGRRRNVCTATGHGEVSFTDEHPEGLAEAGKLLVANGYLLQPIDLLAGSGVPQACEALIVANPIADLGPARDMVADYLAADGRVLALVDPRSDVDLNPVLSRYGISVRRGIVFETDPSSALPEDQTAPIVRRFAASHPIARRVPPSFFPAPQGLDVAKDDPEQNLITTRLAETSDRSFLETRPLTPEFNEGQDTPGPIVVAAAAETSRLEGEGAKRTRLVVFADLDFATNAVVREAGNATFLLHAMDWLTATPDELVLSANLPPYRPLALTAAQLTYARVLAAGIIPGLFLLLGATVWALRRGR